MKAALSFELIDLAEVTTELVDAVRMMVDQANVRLTLDCLALPAPVYVDPRRWSNGLLRLLSCAVNAAVRDELTIRLAPVGGSAVLRLTGIDASQLHDVDKRLDRESNRVPSPMTHLRQGNHDLSSALNATRELVEQYGGTIEIEAIEGSDGSLIVSLPFGDDPLAAKPLDAKQSQSDALSGSGHGSVGKRPTDTARRFEEFADAAPAMLWITEPDGVCSFLSSGWYEFTGQTEDQALGFGWLEAVHPDDRESSGRVFQEANLRREPFSLDYRLRRADGQYRWAIDAGRPRLDHQGRFLGFVGSVIDVHERKLTENELKHSVAILEGITKGTRELIAAQDDQYRYIYFNNAYKRTFESLWGQPLMHGVNMLEAMAAWPDELEKARKLWGRAHAGETFSVVMEFGPNESEARVFDLHFNPLYDDTGNRVGAAHILRDVTEQVRMQDALRESELRYRLVGQAANDAIWDWNLTTNMVTWNEGLQTHFGFAADEVGEDSTWWTEQIHPSDRKRVVLGIHAAIDSGETQWNDEYRFKTSDGGYAIVFDRGTIVHDNNGTPIRMAGSMLDVTERRISEKRQQFLTELATTTQSLSDPDEVTAETARLLAEHLDTDRCAYADVINEDMFIVTGDYSRGVPNISGRWPVAAFGEACERQMRACEPFVVDDADNDPRITTDCRQAYQELRLKAVVCVPLHKYGRFTAAMAVHHTSPRRWQPEEVELIKTVAAQCWEAMERAHANRRLRESEERFRRLVEGAPFGMYIVDSQLRIVQMNARSQAGAFRNIRPILGRHIDEVMRILWPEDVAADILTAFKRTIETGLPYYSKDFVNRRVDLGAVEGYEWELQRHALADGQFGVICYYFDSSQLHLAQEALREADRRKDEFLATLAHELRNPLAPIRTGLELLKLSKNDPDAWEETRQVMERQTLQLVTLVDDLLDVSRITRGKLNLRRSPVRLDDVIRSAVEASTPLIEEANHRLNVHVPPSPTLLDADPNRMTQVISNLLTNAARYTPPGGTIDLTSCVDDGHIVIRVKDTGVGIPNEMQQRIFEMFNQGARSTETGHTGLGIGLTLVKTLVEMHNGTIEVESAGTGKGSEFRVRLPLLPHRDGEQAHESQSEELPQDFGLRVLVVDDNRGAAHLLSVLCEKFGNDVRKASDGHQAVETAAEFRPQVVLMDMNMPVLDGCEAARRIRSTPWGESVLLVAVTGNGQEIDRERSKEAGFDEHLVKPIDAAELRRLFSSI